jgi:anti-sigma regulatory factor (Ser/Thr protein kinase)
MNRTMLDTTSRLPPALASAASARHLVRDALTQAGVDCWATVDTAVLLVSEVVTNAVVHAHTPVDVHIAVRGPVVRIEARDGSTTPPRLPHVDAGATSGRGLAMVDELASSWGSVVGPDGKTVWFELRDEPADEPATRPPSAGITSAAGSVLSDPWAPSNRPSDAIEGGRRELGISSMQLWLDYLAVGGRASWIALQGFLRGEDPLPPAELDRLAQALDDRRLTSDDVQAAPSDSASRSSP